MSLLKSCLRVAAGFAFAVGAFAADGIKVQAQDWPTRTVRFVVPIGPGSGADIAARLLGEKLSAKWGQPVVIENRPGGEGTVALTTFLTSRDDHSFLYGPTTTFVGHPYLLPRLPYDPQDLAPIARVSSTIITIAGAPSFGAKTLKEAIDKVKAEPGKFNWTTTAGATDLIVRSFIKNAGLDMVRVPYRDAVQGQNDVAQGRLHLYWSAYAIIQSQVQAGRINVLATTSSAPVPMLPGVPTTDQSGFPELTLDGLAGLFGTRETPVPLRERIAADIKAVLDDETIVTRLTATGQTVVPGSAAEFAAAFEEQRQKFAGFAKNLGITPVTFN